MAFRAGDHQGARARFEAAVEAGLDTPTLHYNLGVVHFKLGNLDAARRSFARVARDPAWGALAHYNLGLTAEAQDDSAAAAEHLRIAFERGSGKLRQLAKLRLDSLSGPGTRRRGAGAWDRYVAVGAGFDDNVILADDATLIGASDEGDYVLEAIGVASRQFSSDAAEGWRVSLGGYYRANAELDEFDFGSGSIGSAYGFAVDTWDLEAGLTGAAQIAGGGLFATTAKLRVSARRSFGAVGLRLAGELSWIEGADEYEYLTGTQTRVGFEVFRRVGLARAALEYGLEVNDRDDLTFTDEFFSFSPTRRRASFELDYDFSPELSAEFRIDIRSSRYDDENIELDTTNTVLRAKRDDDRLGISLRVSQHISGDWRVFGEYRYDDSDSSFERYGYRNSRYLVGIELVH